MNMKAVKIIITVILAIILTVLLFATCVLAGIRNQFTEDGIRDMSERLDLYDSLSKALNDEGTTLEKWLEEQSSENLLTRIDYSETGLRAISALEPLHEAVKGKLQDYVSDFTEGNGKGKITKDELMGLANDLSGDLEKYLNYRVEPSDLADLEKYLDSQDLSKYDLSNILESVPALKLAAKIFASNIWLYALAGIIVILIVVIILVNRNREIFVALGIPCLVAGCLLLLINFSPLIASSFLPGIWLGIANIFFGVLNIFFNYMLWGGIALVAAGLILFTVYIIISVVRKKQHV